LQLGAEKKEDGSVAKQMVLEVHSAAALEVEHLQVNDWLEFEYSPHWPHRNYSRSQELGSYAEKWICRSIYAMSRKREGPLREAPPRPG
jgi:hypothetical protein